MSLRLHVSIVVLIEMSNNLLQITLDIAFVSGMHFKRTFFANKNE